MEVEEKKVQSSARGGLFSEDGNKIINILTLLTAVCFLYLVWSSGLFHGGAFLTVLKYNWLVFLFPVGIFLFWRKSQYGWSMLATLFVLWIFEAAVQLPDAFAPHSTTGNTGGLMSLLDEIRPTPGDLFSKIGLWSSLLIGICLPNVRQAISIRKMDMAIMACSVGLLIAKRFLLGY
ncbi:hypothetical protein FUAX_41150 (plasmid) [Fulvitalea axinellae]|uniref:Uncharacterized protein n=1 Tax=Fulvitalea axinellae TaxID=1182444 RepID=A0AAU9CN31_9BACT|nr:hypothetical protein FUAX_41150 [Fulvitalea axinellae]